MAPIFATATGVTPQVLEDASLKQLLQELKSLSLQTTLTPTTAAGTSNRAPELLEKERPPVNIQNLCRLLQPWQDGLRFEEQVDLHEWIFPLNVMDAVIRWALATHPGLLLIAPVERNQGTDHPLSSAEASQKDHQLCAETLEQVIVQPSNPAAEDASSFSGITAQLLIILNFMASLLRNSVNKNLFQTVEESVDLLAAADDELSDAALAVLQAAAIPAALHKQQQPDVHQHVTALHNSKMASHSRLVSSARGWGSAASGLGLYAVVTADDSVHGQGALPAEAGEVHFCYYRNEIESGGSTSNNSSETDSSMTDDESQLNRISMTEQDIINDSPDTAVAMDTGATSSSEHSVSDHETTASAAEGTSTKRRRVGPRPSRRCSRETKSTSELFFLALGKAGGRSKIPTERLFGLLADIRLARSFYSHDARVRAVERRLRAVTSILYAHPSQEVLTGYFQAQPELCVEMVDLLRPIVSAANVSASSSAASGRIPPTIPAAGKDTGASASTSKYVLPKIATSTASPLHQDAIESLSNDSPIPYNVRILACEALTALVARREGGAGSLSGTARLSSVLMELGVGKGQYLGLLPTLIRYSLAALGSLATTAASSTISTAISATDAENRHGDGIVKMDTSEKSPQASVATISSFDIGLAFVEATMPPRTPRIIQVERALEFIDRVLALTSAVVATPTGTSALTDCGLVPALLSTVQRNSNVILQRLLPDLLCRRSSTSNASTLSQKELQQLGRIETMLRFVTAATVQILEGAIVTHSNALTAFHDLHGVDVLTSRLSTEISNAESTGKHTTNDKQGDFDDHKMDLDEKNERVAEDADVEMRSTENDKPSNDSPTILSSQRVLLYCIVTCLSVVFHQESTSSSTAQPTSGAQLRKKELTTTLIQIMNHIDAYGGHLASLISTLLSDVMNSDPHVVHYIHKSGIAKSFLNMVIGKKSPPGSKFPREPIIPPVPELIMAIPNVLSALSLTEDGAKAVQQANPFPSLLRLFYHPAYAMPRSRCLLNEMTAIVGTGLDEIMRHVERLKPLVLAAISAAMNDVVEYAGDLTEREASNADSGQYNTDLEDERSCLIQYVLNVGQLLEQILHNEDHVEPFVESGGLDALLALFPASMPTGLQFLAHVSSLSSPSVSTLHHSTTEESLALAFKCIEMRYSPLKLLRKLKKAVQEHLDTLEEKQMDSFHTSSVSCIMDQVSDKPLYQLPTEPKTVKLAAYLRSVAIVQWSTCLLSTAIKAACQRSQEHDTGWSRTDREWKIELSNKEFEELFARLAVFHQTSIFEVCRCRTTENYDSSEKQRWSTPNSVRFRLRIVCPEGAVVRDGIDIDSCASVGSMEMGEICTADDRCVNSSGILRYRTDRGWVSEMTRGHGREPIAEVVALWEEGGQTNAPSVIASSGSQRRIEATIPGLRTVAVGVLARVQNSYSELFSSVSRLVIASLSVRNLSFDANSPGAHVSTIMRMLTKHIKQGFQNERVAEVVIKCNADDTQDSCSLKRPGAAMYLGCMLTHLQACIFDGKRERRMINFPLLLSLLSCDTYVLGIISDGESKKEDVPKSMCVFESIRFVFSHALKDFTTRSTLADNEAGVKPDNSILPRQCVDRSVAASFPPTVSFLRRLMSTPLSSSPAASIMSRIKWKDLPSVLGQTNDQTLFTSLLVSDEDAFFQPENFLHSMQLSISCSVKEVWLDPAWRFAPSFLVHPAAGLVGDILVALEDTSKKKSVSSVSGRDDPVAALRSAAGNGLLLSDYFRGRRRQDVQAAPPVNEDNFEASDTAIAQLQEMGFSREHAVDALESTRSNRVEVAMEYALAHPPPSPESSERRRQQQQSREGQQEEETNNNRSNNEEQQQDSASNNNNADAEQHEQNQEDNDRSQSADNATERHAEEGGNNGSGQNAGTNADEHMDVEPSSNAKLDTEDGSIDSDGRVKKLVDKGKKKNIVVEKQLERTKLELASWIEELPIVCCNLLGATSVLSTVDPSQKKSDGDGEAEATTVVIGSFLLDLCHRYPARRQRIVQIVLRELKVCLESGTTMNEKRMASLVHAAVLFTRALPKTRTLVLEFDLVRPIIQCCRQRQQREETSWPVWLAPCLLLLDIMAQPVVAFGKDKMVTEKEISNNTNKSELDQVLSEMAQPVVAFGKDKMVTEKEISNNTNKSELDQVLSEHKKQAADIAGMAKSIFSALSGHDSKAKKTSTVESESPESSFSTVPAYFPLLPSDSVEGCLDICLGLISHSCADNTKSSEFPPPGVAHAALLLLLRLLRTPRVSAQCLRMGVAEDILKLPGECRFTGNTGLVTLIFRRLLEDESSLRTAMEIEIRSAVTKLSQKQKAAASARSEKPRVSLRPFIEAVTPLLCRDPGSFLKSMAVSVQIGTKKDSSSSSSECIVSLLSSEERSRKLTVLNDLFPTTPSSNKTEDTSHGRRESTSSSSSRNHRRSLGGKEKHTLRGSKRCLLEKRKKKERTSSDTSAVSSSAHCSASSSPAVHVTGLLINGIVTSTDVGYCEDGEEDDSSFLWTGNFLDILADLVLAVPSCASAVHNYRPHRVAKDKFVHSHALAGCPAPPRTFCSYLLHELLPQDRWSVRNDPQVWDRRKQQDNEVDGSTEEAVAVKRKKKAAYRRTKVSQSAARVLVALVVRPGEGRKRVISDLVFALSGGQLGQYSNSNSLSTKANSTGVASANGRDLHALQAWGELCLGLAAPRSNGKNVEGIHSVSLENCRILLEHGTAHALLFAMHRVQLYKPMASLCTGALVLPLELLTRVTVTNGVNELVQKLSKLQQQKAEGLHKSLPAVDGEQPVQDQDVDFGMQRQNSRHDDERSGAVEYDDLMDTEEDVMQGGSDNHEDNEGDDDEMDGEEGSVEDDEDDEVSSSGEEESDEDSDESSEEDSEGSEMDDEESSEGDAISVGMPHDEVEDEGEWNVDYNDEFAADHNENQPLNGVIEDDETGRIEQGIDEGWTRIESSGFGGMLLGGRRHLISAGDRDGDQSSRTRGFIDAAEAMIGTLLRTGEINSDALAEIEGTLGIRIMSNTRALQASLGGAGASNLAESLAVRVLGGDAAQSEQGRRGEVTGTLPHINQRNQPDVGYSVFGNGGRGIEVSSMEYVYGGPSVTTGSRNYDLVSPMREAESSADDHPSLTQLDLQLFPGGPTSAASARTQHALHPLLCGVDLPPVNSLVSDLLPHGIRATRRGQMTTRRPGDWTNASFSPGGYLVSTSNGNIIRSNRSNSGAPLGSGLPSRNVSGPVGWTDDGLPFDATVEEFSSSFERALQETTRIPSSAPTFQSGEQQDATGTPTDQARSASQGEDGESTAVESSDPPGAENSNIATETPQPSLPTAETDASASRPEEDSNPASEGDRVASSLAEGLVLSPRSVGSDSSDRMSVVASAGEETEAAASATGNRNGEQAAIAGSDARMENNEAAAGLEQDASVETERNLACQRPESHLPNSSEADVQNSEETTETQQAETSETPQEEGSDENNPQPNGNGLVCPPDIDLEVFNSLPLEMQQDLVNQHNSTQELAAQIDGTSLDPEVLAALPEDMRREVIEQERRERQMREQQEQAPADPSQAEEMDNASFIASLAPDLREEILLQADDAFLSSLPPNIVAEAQILRERASAQHQNRRMLDAAAMSSTHREGGNATGAQAQRNAQVSQSTETGASAPSRRRRSGKMRVESDREHVVYLPESLSDPVASADVKFLIRLQYLLSPVRPPRLLQRIIQNLCLDSSLRTAFMTAFVKLLHEDGKGACEAVESLEKEYGKTDDWRRKIDEWYNHVEFPPSILLGAVPDVPNSESFNMNISASLLRRKHGFGAAAAFAANLPTNAGGSRNDSNIPPVVASRIIDTLLQLCKNSPRFSFHMLLSPCLEEKRLQKAGTTCFDRLLDLLDKPMYSKSSANLEQLLTLLESAVSPLSYLPRRGDEEIEIPQQDIDAAAATGREWVDAPRVSVSQSRLQLLCSILRMETCRDTAFTKVNTIVRRLCRVETNRGYVLSELASVAHALGGDAVRDLRALRIRMDDAVSQHQHNLGVLETKQNEQNFESGPGLGASGAISSSVTLSTSTSELKLLRVLQTLHALCGDNPDEAGKKHESSVIVTEELVHLLRQMQFDGLWDELSSCLKVVQVLEGVHSLDQDDEKKLEESESNNDDESGDGSGTKGKKLRNSAAGLLTRFLPSIEAFFVANASATRPKNKSTEDDASPSGHREEIGLDNLVEGKRLINFVMTNKVLLNALVRNNSSLLDKGLRALVQIPRCRVVLDFDVKRQWFKTQMRRMRQQASRRHGSLRLHIRRKYVFEDAYHQLRLRNADEMRGRLHITFRNEEGVDAGGLSREFFGILAKEIFNPNYALFTSTEDGCTFQPNSNSSINPDHLSYFRFVGRIVGKAVADGYLLDAHFTRSLYKHMLGLEPTHDDMEAIDPDYYKNLKTILEHNLEDIGLELTFSLDDHSFGRNQTLDLIPNGRNVHVTEENKEEYVRKVCQHRMTTAIKNQIKAYLAGFYELVSPELIAIFTPRELELLISGLPDIDVHDLKKNSLYNGWKATDKEIEWFWNIMFSLSRSEKAAFLQFVTGSSKVPLAGFSELQGMRGVQKFSINKVGGTSGALMSAHTCFNSLDLPRYNSEEETREKLLYAIAEGGGAFMFA